MKEKQEKQTQSEVIKQAWEQAEDKSRLVVKVRKGDNFPLLSDWEVDDMLYRVVGVYVSGYVELAKVSK